MSVVEAQTARPQHQRTKSTFSFRSNTSEKSQKNKMDLRESASEKARRHLSVKTKANPNAAMNEAQPSKLVADLTLLRGTPVLIVAVAAAYEDVTISSLRSMQHKDDSGAVIS